MRRHDGEQTMTDNGFKGLRITNTLTRMKEDFIPADPKDVRMYVCGPTVYDFAHIGNARPAIVFDVLFRLLRHLYGEDHVTYVRNLTDVDDKINARALRDYGDRINAGEMTLNEAIRHVTETTAAQYHKDVAALGCLPPTHEPRATEHIAGMVTMIQQLIDKGHAYIASGAEGAEVLFATGSMDDYGQLSKRNLDEQQAGARIDVKDHKRNPGDFVLWKESEAHEPGWEGTFTLEGATRTIHGRPGWHIECSVMSKAFLGETFDIHGGGLDLIFPHHENEIAQSRCAHGSDVMAKYWMHNGFLQVEGRKMSKSDGNFVTIHELLETEKFGGRKWPGEVLRLAMLMTHYKEPIDFSVRRLEEAEAKLRRWYEFAKDPRKPAPHISLPDPEEYLRDDLNTASFIRALDGIIQMSRDLPKYGWSKWFTEIDNRYGLLLDFEAVFGASKLGIDEASIADIADKRLALIAEKNWAEADRIRDELLAQGIQLKDGKDPETGERVTTWEVKR